MVVKHEPEVGITTLKRGAYSSLLVNDRHVQNRKNCIYSCIVAFGVKVGTAILLAVVRQRQYTNLFTLSLSSPFALPLLLLASRFLSLA